eukprot:gnl/Chilomastix_cuspidata/375.p1 GENE.gnl/Chilomastix_cuspidata/375~~gnl/Chilomastix_cuspidata/375.p1  ORF type:complete len:456 (-),score=173.49 gnl/Chilomastix_cuspidata/375:33-1400(-)
MASTKSIGTMKQFPDIDRAEGSLFIDGFDLFEHGTTQGRSQFFLPHGQGFSGTLDEHPPSMLTYSLFASAQPPTTLQPPFAAEPCHTLFESDTTPSQSSHAPTPAQAQAQAPPLQPLGQGRQPQNITLEEIFRTEWNLRVLSSCQNGSRQIQAILEEAAKDPLRRMKIRVFVMSKLTRNEFLGLSLNPFGNYVAQKLIEILRPKFREHIAALIEGDSKKLSFNVFGCRVLQSLLRYSDLTRHSVTRQLTGRARECATNSSANHVLQKLIEHGEPEQYAFVAEELCQDSVLSEVSNNRFGCLVVQKLFQHGSDAQKERLLAELVPSSAQLSKSPFGNYVVQTSLKACPASARSFYEQLRADLVGLSCLKHSSNVIEVILQAGDEALRQEMIVQLLDFETLKALASNHFGSFVIQSAFKVASIDQARDIAAVLSRLEKSSLSSSQIRHIRSLIKSCR